MQIPARVDGMVSSAYAKRENGSALRKNAATKRWPQVRPERGSRSRRTAIATARTAVPNSRRPNVTWNGAYPSVPTLMRRKLKPQMRESATNRMRQSTAGRGAVVVAEGRGCRAAARFAVRKGRSWLHDDGLIHVGQVRICGSFRVALLTC